MIKLDEDSLICDLAETYNIYSYKQLPPLQVAVLVCGLRDNSRIKLKLSNQNYPIDTILLAGISDKVNYLLWSMSKDGQRNQNKPKSILDILLPPEKKEKEELIFESGEDFEKERNRIIKKTKMGGG